MIAKDLLGWYETTLPPRERKMRGHFSTPPRLVEQILDACGYTADHDLSHLRVLDPACGSGNFLTSAARRLSAFAQRTTYTDASAAALVQRNIWGFDPDPIACFLAEMQLREVLGEQHQQLNAEEPAVLASRRTPQKQRLALHIHQADGLAIPWGQSQNIDLFLANPPYLAAKNNDLSGYRGAQQRGQSDSYLLFLNLALQVVRPNGWIGMVVPDPLLARANAAQERQRLLAETTVHHLWHLADVFAAYVGAVVIIAQKRPPSSIHQVSWKRERWIRTPLADVDKPAPHNAEHEHVAMQHSAAQTVAQTLLRSQPKAELRYLLSNAQETLIERLHAHLYAPAQHDAQRTLAFLDNYVCIRRGEELGKASPLLCRIQPGISNEWYPVLCGGTDIRPYTIPTAQHWIAQMDLKKQLERYLAPKLLVVKSMGRLQATLDLQGHVILQTLYQLHLRTPGPPTQDCGCASQHEEDELYFLLALLNSQVLSDYIYTFHTAYKWVQPQIEQHILAHLPIPIVATSPEKTQIVQRARHLMRACSASSSVVKLKAQSTELYAEQERAICALYAAAL